MKKFYTLSFILLTSLSFGQSLLNENFNYTVPGNVGGNTTTTTDGTGSNNWLTHSNTSGNSGSIDLVSGSLSYTGLATSVGNKVVLPGSNTSVPRDINRAIATTSSQVVYYSTLLNVTDNSQLGTTAGYFMGLGATAGVGVTTLGARLGITSASGTNYRLSIQNISGGTPTFSEVAQDLNFGITYLIVVKYDITVAAATIATLWINPSSLGGVEPAGGVSNASGTSSFTTFASVYLRNSTNTPKAEIDEIRVGETWASVTPSNLSVKQNSISGLNVYPNPVSNGVLYITSNSSNAKTVSVYDILGKQVVGSKTVNNAVNVSNLMKGAYIVKITEEGNTETRKLIIE